jgi:hypothetical protein
MDDMADLAAKQAQDLVAWADDLLRADGHSAATLEAIADALRQLGRELALRPEAALAGLHGATAAATVLARALDGPVLMLARFPPEAPTPVHNHNSWGMCASCEAAIATCDGNGSMMVRTSNAPD